MDAAKKHISATTPMSSKASRNDYELSQADAKIAKLDYLKSLNKMHRSKNETTPISPAMKTAAVPSEKASRTLDAELSPSQKQMEKHKGIILELRHQRAKMDPQHVIN